jgi:carbon-monoxide dehydrogenase large subunit
MTNDLSRRKAIALAGAAILAPALGGASSAFDQKGDSSSPPGATASAEIAPGDAFARNLEALPRNVEKMLTGRAVYVDDVRFDGEAAGVVVRSPHPHARIRAIDVSAARAAPGVLAVLTGGDVARMAKPLPCVIPPSAYGRAKPLHDDRPILAVDRVRHVGDGLAFVVAETMEQANQAADLVKVDYELLPAYVEPRAGTAEAPIWADVPDNVAFDWKFGDAVLCRKLFDQAAHTVRIRLSIPRVIPNPIEPRAAIGLYDPHADRLTLVSNPQGVHFVRGVLTRALALPDKKLRVVSPYLGGAFGSKIYAYPEHALVLLAARTVGRPVRWTSTRAEAFLSDTQGRGHTTEAALALDENGRFLALSVRPTVDLGAYFSQLTPITATGVGAPVQGGGYRFQAIEINVRGIFTNKVPVDAYRGAGRPEATYVLERLIDRAAAELKIDPAGLRARNLPASATAPFTAVTGLPIDGGRFLDNQRLCLERADRAGFAARRAEAATRGRLRGFGFANYLEANGGLQVSAAIAPGDLPHECAALKFGADGTMTVTIGTQSSGQDHACPVALYVSDKLGFAADAIVVREGDSDALPVGGGTGGSKSTLTSSVAIKRAVDIVITKARVVAARTWNVHHEAVRFERGVFSVAGSRQTVGFAELVAQYPGLLDSEGEAALQFGSSANGCHACEVEIDPDMGAVEIVRYTAVDDFGRVINAANVRGQVQGGVAIGLGQALAEIAPTPEAMQRPLATSNFNHALRRAADIPTVDWVDNGMPLSTNVFGAKACGESGASAAPPTVMNAIADALRDYPRARDLQMPARPADVWAVVAPGAHAADRGPRPRRRSGAVSPARRFLPASRKSFDQR